MKSEKEKERGGERWRETTKWAEVSSYAMERVEMDGLMTNVAKNDEEAGNGREQKVEVELDPVADASSKL